MNAWLLAAAVAAADPETLDAITVTATRVPRFAEEVPASVDVVGDPGPAPGIGLSEWLQGVPGLVLRERQNHAQDTQVSVRGFGARASFGIRGLRVLVDGIPASQPDGQAQISHVNLASAATVEVLRGPFSALHGNASGGVIRVDSGSGTARPEFGLGTAAGGGRDARVSLSARGRAGGWGYVLGASAFDSEGLRPQSAAQRESFNLRLHQGERADGEGWSFVLNRVDSPRAEDPLGLSRAQFEADPRQTTPQALAFGTRKRFAQDQLGLRWRGDVAGVGVEATAWAGRREVWQMLAVPAAAQANPLHGGGVVDLDNDYAGLQLQFDGEASLAGRPLAWVLGASHERLAQHRRGYENFVGARTGLQGALRRDERNRVASGDVFAQADWAFARDWSLLAGLRGSRLRFRSDDRYITADNPDDSGALEFRRWTPVLGLRRALGERGGLHLAWGSGFETPTLVELAYRPDGLGGLNLDLRPARSRSLELGLKWRDEAWSAAASLFRTDTRDELLVAGSSGGRTSYRNAGRSRRDGLELEFERELGEDWLLRGAWTWLDAELREGSAAAGTPLPGISDRQAWLRLQWQPDGDWQAWAQLRHVGRVTADDAGSEVAAAHTLVDAGLARDWRRDGHSLRLALWLDNLADRDYAGSVIVNEGNGRYFEPGPGRTVWVSLDWRWRGG